MFVPSSRLFRSLFIPSSPHRLITCSGGSWPRSRKWRTLEAKPIFGSHPLFLSSLFSWQSAHDRQHRCVQQSLQGDSGSPYLARKRLRYPHVYRNGQSPSVATCTSKNRQQAVDDSVNPSVMMLTFLPTTTHGQKSEQQAPDRSSKHPQRPVVQSPVGTPIFGVWNAMRIDETQPTMK